MNGRSPFSAAEYARRLRLTREAMQKAGLDAMFVTDPSNQAWLTGYDGWSFYVHQGVIVTNEGEPIWWGRHMDMMGGRRTCWMDHDNILGYGDHYVQSSEIHPMQDLAGVLKARGLEKARIGVEMENYYYSAKAHAVLTHELPKAYLADATGLVNWQRLIKSTRLWVSLWSGLNLECVRMIWLLILCMRESPVLVMTGGITRPSCR